MYFYLSRNLEWNWRNSPPMTTENIADVTTWPISPISSSYSCQQHWHNMWVTAGLDNKHTVRTALSNEISRTFQGLFKDNFSRTENYWGWHSHIHFFLHKAGHLSFENEAANTHAGGDLGQNSNGGTMFIFLLTVVSINMKNTCLDWFKQFWVMNYL